MIFIDYNVIACMVCFIYLSWWLSYVAIWFYRYYFGPIDWTGHEDLKQLLDETSALIRRIENERKCRVWDDIQ